MSGQSFPQKSIQSLGGKDCPHFLGGGQEDQIEVNKVGNRLLLITGQPEPVFFSFTYFCYRVKFCVKSYSMVGMIAWTNLRKMMRY